MPVPLPSSVGATGVTGRAALRQPVAAAAFALLFGLLAALGKHLVSCGDQFLLFGGGSALSGGDAGAADVARLPDCGLVLLLLNEGQLSKLLLANHHHGDRLLLCLTGLLGRLDHAHGRGGVSAASTDSASTAAATPHHAAPSTHAGHTGTAAAALSLGDLRRGDQGSGHQGGSRPAADFFAKFRKALNSHGCCSCILRAVQRQKRVGWVHLNRESGEFRPEGCRSTHMLWYDSG
jgi:hypothetical protein